ncbi:MAG: N-acetyltransferase family protein [Alphaproteobacteria bacterium]|nr:N-acetyltransferase family protein [Alphaproteobacteria bacterium]
MAERVVIRRVEERDLSAIQAIYAHHVRHGTASFEIEPPDVPEMTRRVRAIMELGLPYLVAEREGQIAGYAYAGLYRPRAAYRFTCEDSVYVAAELTGRGIGLPLLRAVVDGATQAGMRQMVAVIGDSQQRPSIRLHEKAGFQMVGTLRHIGWKFGRWLDSVLMQRALGEGNETPAPSSR